MTEECICPCGCGKLSHTGGYLPYHKQKETKIDVEKQQSTKIHYCSCCGSIKNIVYLCNSCYTKRLAVMDARAKWKPSVMDEPLFEEQPPIHPEIPPDPDEDPNPNPDYDPEEEKLVCNENHQ